MDREEAIQKGTRVLDEINIKLTDIKKLLSGDDPGPAMRAVDKKTLEFFMGQVDWIADGEHIKVEYVYNLINDLDKALSSNKTRMNWPFAEESVQEGANREMDKEDAPTKPTTPSILEEEWMRILSPEGVIDQKAGDVIFLLGWLREIAALLDALRALVMIWEARGGMETHRDGSRVRLLITQAEWEAIEAALKKAGIGE